MGDVLCSKCQTYEGRLCKACGKGYHFTHSKSGRAEPSMSRCWHQLRRQKERVRMCEGHEAPLSECDACHARAPMLPATWKWKWPQDAVGFKKLKGLTEGQDLLLCPSCQGSFRVGLDWSLGRGGEPLLSESIACAFAFQLGQTLAYPSYDWRRWVRLMSPEHTGVQLQQHGSVAYYAPPADLGVGRSPVDIWAVHAVRPDGRTLCGFDLRPSTLRSLSPTFSRSRCSARTSSARFPLKTPTLLRASDAIGGLPDARELVAQADRGGPRRRGPAVDGLPQRPLHPARAAAEAEHEGTVGLDDGQGLVVPERAAGAVARGRPHREYFGEAFERRPHAPMVALIR